MKIEKAASISLERRFVLTGPDGKVKFDSGRKKSHSFLKQFMKGLRIFLDDSYSIEGTLMHHDGVLRYIPNKGLWDMNNYPMSLDTGDECRGIQVGSAILIPIDNENFKLNLKIADGVGSGELQYGAMSIIHPAVISGTIVEWSMSRGFTNGSGASVIVREIGIYCDTTAGTYGVCIARDILESEITVPDGYTLTVYYVLRTENQFTIQWWNIWATIYSDFGVSPSVKATDGTSQDVYGKSYWDDSGYPVYFLGGGSNYGIVIGTDGSAEDPADFALGAKIGDGTGVGQMQYKTQEEIDMIGPCIEIEDGYVQWDIWRSFWNCSGAAITVREIGIQCRYYPNKYALIVRTVLNSPIVVENNRMLNVRYRLRTRA